MISFKLLKPAIFFKRLNELNLRSLILKSRFYWISNIALNVINYYLIIVETDVRAKRKK